MGKWRRVLITGAAGSLGTALAAAWAARGCGLILCDVDGAALDRVVSRLPAGTAAQRHVVDITDDAAVRALFDRLNAAREAPDIVVHNAAVSHYGRFQDVPAAQWERLLAVNLLGAMRVTQHALPPMLARCAGHLVFISSLSGLCASAGLSAYAASKHALHGFAESLYLELRPLGIGVSVICPSTLRSEIAARMGIYLGPTASPEAVEAWRARRARLHQTRGISCEAVAARSVRAVIHRQFLDLVGWDAHLGYLAKRLLGRGYWPILAKTAIMRAL